MADDERRRLAEPSGATSEWYLWGPYLSERQWGTVREDYSADGSAWTYLPHDHARSRAYRWGEDGLAGFSDHEQRLCLGIALWNGRDPILKERPFGLTGPEGNHGEDVKDYWWYLDAVPSHAWNRWRYHYPQAEFPYADLVAENGRRGRKDPEYELLDTGVFDQDRFWIVDLTYAKASPTDLLMSVRVTNAGPEREVVHVLPTVWFRNTWAWTPDAPRPELGARGNTAVGITHPVLGELELLTAPGSDGTLPSLLFCENETNTDRLYGVTPATPYPKDGINDHVVSGAPTINPARKGTKCAAWYSLSIAPGATVELRLRLRPTASSSDPQTALGTDFDRVMAARRAEADDFYAERSAVCCGANSCTPSPWLAGSTATPDSLRLLVSGVPAATPGGAPSMPSTSCPCRTSGSIRGSRPGTWRFTALPWPTSIPGSRRTNSC
jgi:hypothetical protein